MIRMFWSQIGRNKKLPQTHTILILTILCVTEVCGGAIFELYSNEGEVLRNALPGNSVNFDAPLRVSNKLDSSVSISLPEPSVERLFSVSPTVVQPGQPFSLALRNSIESLMDVDTINITIHGALMDRGNTTVEELEILQIYFMNPPISAVDIALKLMAHEYFVNLTEHTTCEAGRTLQNLRVDNAEKIVFENFGFDIVGKYADLFQLDAVEKSADEKYLELKFSDDCGASVADETLQNRFAGEAQNLSCQIPPLILQISALRTPNNSASNRPSIYLIHFVCGGASTSSATDDELVRGEVSLPLTRFQSQRPIETEIVEKSRHFSPIFRLKIYENSSDFTNSAPVKEANLARNFSFSIDSFDDNDAVTRIFSVHPRSGVVNIKSPDDLTIEKVGNAVRFNVTLFEDRKWLDECEVLIHIRSANSAVYKYRNVNSDADGGDAGEQSAFRFEQPVYAFAVGPGTKEVGSVRLRTVSASAGEEPKGSISYAISEGGASYFRINADSGQIFYHGPLERSAKNYTIKAIAYDNKLELVESTSVQILVAGIGSSPPQISKNFDVIEIPQDTPPGKIIYLVRGVDFDPDARLNYRIIEWSCLSILGQPIADESCRNSVHFGGQGHRNGSLIFTGLNPSAKTPFPLAVHERGAAFTGESAADEPSATMNASEFVRRKTAALASIFVNVSVTDVSHPLEPSEYAAFVVRLVRNTKLRSNSTRKTRRCQRKFDFGGTQSAPQIQIDDSLPPNSYIYTVKVCEPSAIDDEYDMDDDDSEKVAGRNTVVNDGSESAVGGRAVMRAVTYSLEDAEENKSKYFAIHPEHGIIRNTASLKGAGAQNITILARDSVNGQTLDTTTLSIHCHNLVDFAPEFAEKFYKFDVSPPATAAAAKSSSKKASSIVGRISANDRNGDLLAYEVVDMNGATSSLPFAIDDQGQILDMLSDDQFQQDVDFSKKSMNKYNFFVRVTEPGSGKSAVVPVQVCVSKSSSVALRPRFKFAAPQKATLMENAPVGTFVAELGALNTHRFTISVSRPTEEFTSQATRPPRSAAEKLSMAEKAERLASALTVHRPTGTIRTFAPLSGLDGVAYWFTVGAYNNSTVVGGTGLPVATVELEVDVLATSKCMPKFASNQKMIFDVMDTKPGAQIAKVSAEIEPNCDLSYDLENTANPADNFGFEIHSGTGLIVVGQNGIHMNAKVDDDGQGMQRLPVVVIAKSGHVLSRLGVELRVRNSNVSAVVSPVFYEQKLHFRVPEDMPVGSVVGRVQARKCENHSGSLSLHESATPAVEYEFEGDFPSRFFSLNSSSGEVRTAADLDVDGGDAPDAFDLKIVAKCRSAENKFGYSTMTADFHVEVVDLNDNSPQFERDDYEFSVDKNALIGTVIGRVSAYDMDPVTSSLYYSLEKATFHRKNAEKRLRDVYFQVAPTSGEIVLHNSLADLSGGVFELSLRVSDAPPPAIAATSAEHGNNIVVDGSSFAGGRSSSAVVQIWVCTPSDLVSFVLAENPLVLNSSKIDGYLRMMANAAPTHMQPTRAFLHDSRYRIVEEEHEMLRDFTILRLIFVDVNRGEIIPPSEVDEFVRDLSLPDLRPLDQNTAQYLSATGHTSTENGGKASGGELAGGEEGGNGGQVGPKTGRQEKNTQTSQFSALLFTAVVFAALLLAIFIALGVILCYYRRRFLRERKFLRDAQIAKAAMSSTKGGAAGAPSTIRQFALANAASAASVDRANHFYPPNPYITDAWENDTSEPSDNFYYSTQEMKISMR